MLKCVKEYESCDVKDCSSTEGSGQSGGSGRLADWDLAYFGFRVFG